MIPLADALTVVRDLRTDEDVVVTTMSSAKVWMDLGAPHARDMVFVPSCMGHATSVALGIALAQPKRRVITCNGDGSMLMSLGSLVTIAGAAPQNLRVIIMENGIYEVTGGQPMPSRPDFGALAKASGITNVFRFDRIRDWAGTARDVLAVQGTTVVVLAIEPVPTRAAPKSPGPAAARAIALREALAR